MKHAQLVILDCIPNNAKFMAIFHEWFVSSNGFTVVTLDAETEDQALLECYKIKEEKSRGNNRVDFKLIQLFVEARS
jgi:hypothetical protein